MAASPSHSDIRRGTALGMVAILLWSTTIAFSRSLTEQLGTFTAASLIYLLAGLAGLVYIAAQTGRFHLDEMPRAYLLGCGALFVAYIVCLYLAVGMAASRVQVLVVGLINYLWPGLSLVFSIPVLGRKANPLLLPLGILTALAGVWLATASSSEGLSLASLLEDRASAWPYLLALLAAVCWGLYSTLSRRLASSSDSNGVPLFLLASGMVLGAVRLFVPEQSDWTGQASLALAYMAFFPGMLAYVLWDTAVRKGEIILIASLSYLTPLLSTVISTVVLQVRPGAGLWAGAVLVMAGAVICSRSVEPED